MTERPDPPEAEVQTRSRGVMGRISIIWIVPLIALAVVAWVGYRSFADQGPLITIAFDQAGSVTAGETEVRFRDVTVGEVEDVRFSPELSQVLIDVRLDPSVAEYVDEDAAFWIVRPVISTQGISGLETVLSGNFIQAYWNSEPGGLVTEFEGLQQAPLLEPGQQGLRVVMRPEGQASLLSDVPILFQGVEVGYIGPSRLGGPEGTTPEAEAVIYAPHNQLITSATRFWDTAGFDVSISAEGATIDFDSISSLIAGAVTFQTFASGGEPLEDGAVVRL